VRRVADAKGGRGSFQAALDREGITEDAWRERVRYTYLAERVLSVRQPVTASDLERLTVRSIRVSTRKAADDLLRALQAGAAWEQAATRSLDRGEGFIQPKMFMKVDKPAIFAAIPPDLPVGAVLSQPVELGGSFYILKLEGRFPASLMTAQQRDAAVRQINGTRVGELLETLRKAQPPEYLTPMRSLIPA